jgi:uncharacterized protein involved in tolerance to divalent cations
MKGYPCSKEGDLASLKTSVQDFDKRLNGSFERLENSLRELILVKFDSIEKATELARSILDERLGRMNEFRDAMKDQAGRFITRDEVTLLFKPIAEDIRELRENKSKLEGKADQNIVNITLGIALIGAIVGISGLLISLFK